MNPVEQWSVREARALRRAMRLSIRDFAELLGVNPRSISKWESTEVCLRPETQAILDTAHARTSDDIKARFELLLRGRLASNATVAKTYTVESHKFMPAYVGTEATKVLASTATRYPHDWLEGSVRSIDDFDGHCDLYVFQCGVAIFHLTQTLELADLTSLALWRYSSYEADIPLAGDILDALAPDVVMQEPEYILSVYVLKRSMWEGSDLDTALRLMASPSVLVDRTRPGDPKPVDLKVEQAFFADKFEHPDTAPFGVQGVSTGFAAWSGLSYYAVDPQRALSTDEVVSCELTAQALWCYCHYILKAIEDGRDPFVPDRYGWRFLRAGHSRLGAARATETSQHCLMRGAIMTTSGLPERLRAAQESLRDSRDLTRGWHREH